VNGTLARSLRWSLFVGAMPVLGDWGLQLLPLWAGGLLPLALWLLACKGMGLQGGAAGGPLAAARWSMLPMMAMLPHMQAWCGAAGPAAGLWWGLHLVLMLLPAWWPRVAAPEVVSRLCAALLLAGGLALWARPGLQGLMAASLLHTLAWSLACTVTAAHAGRGLHGLAAPAALLLLGAAVARAGPSALVLVHAALALACLASLLWQAWSRGRALVAPA
jgi:hypothetical protein